MRECRQCRRKLPEVERAEGRCSNEAACRRRLERRYASAVRAMAKPKWTAQQERAAYTLSPKIGDPR